MNKLNTGLLFAVLLQACAPYNGPTSQYRTLNGVKLITPGITLGDDSRAYQQTEYSISASSRLLLRYENLLTEVTASNVTATSTASVQLTMVNASDRAAALTELALCPVSKDWMMLATWIRAHPFAGIGAWAAPGGDYSASDCVLGAANGTDASAIDFDVSSWFKSHVGEGSGRANLGFLLLNQGAATTYRVQGETSSNAASITWQTP